MSYLGRYYDGELDISSIASREELERQQVERISRALAVVIFASKPRRLGGDATDFELALDKKRARRTAHALGQSLRQWTKKRQDLPNDDSVRIEGAQISWDEWRTAYCAEVNRQLRCVATYATRSDDTKWGKSAVVRLENELKWIEFSLRD